MIGFVSGGVASSGNRAVRVGLRTSVCSARRNGGDLNRREALRIGLGVVLGGWAALDRSEALVKGSTPPKDFAKRESGNRASNITEAREIGAAKETELFGEVGGGDFKVGPDGDRYRDIVEGTGKMIENGSEVDVRYRVLKAGKRSPDGLEGEGSLVFSLGYGEDGDKPGDVITVKAGDENLIAALRNTFEGMREGGKKNSHFTTPPRPCSIYLSVFNVNATVPPIWSFTTRFASACILRLVFFVFTS